MVEDTSWARERKVLGTRKSYSERQCGAFPCSSLVSHSQILFFLLCGGRKEKGLVNVASAFLIDANDVFCRLKRHVRPVTIEVLWSRHSHLSRIRNLRN